jgi:galactoside O-acetyltransferase
MRFAMSSFYTEEELSGLGLGSYGQNVYISKKASIYFPEKIYIGKNVRIDDFCFLSGNIKLYNYIHIASGSYLYGASAGIIMEDFSGLSQRVLIMADSEDYSGEYLTNPMIFSEFKNNINAPVLIKKHCIVGACCTIQPGVILKEGSAIGSMSLVTKDTEPWSINFGIPSRKIKERSKRLLELESKFLDTIKFSDHMPGGGGRIT